MLPLHLLTYAIVIHWCSMVSNLGLGIVLALSIYALEYGIGEDTADFLNPVWTQFFYVFEHVLIFLVWFVAATVLKLGLSLQKYPLIEGWHPTNVGSMYGARIWVPLLLVAAGLFFYELQTENSYANFINGIICAVLFAIAWIAHYYLFKDKGVANTGSKETHQRYMMTTCLLIYLPMIVYVVFNFIYQEFSCDCYVSGCVTCPSFIDEQGSFWTAFAAGLIVFVLGLITMCFVDLPSSETYSMMTTNKKTPPGFSEKRPLLNDPTPSGTVVPPSNSSVRLRQPATDYGY